MTNLRTGIAAATVATLGLFGTGQAHAQPIRDVPTVRLFVTCHHAVVMVRGETGHLVHVRAGSNGVGVEADLATTGTTHFAIARPGPSVEARVEVDGVTVAHKGMTGCSGVLPGVPAPGR